MAGGGQGSVTAGTPRYSSQPWGSLVDLEPVPLAVRQ